MTRRTLAAALALFALPLGACGAPVEPRSEAAQSVGRSGLSADLDALLFGSDSPCRGGPECPSGQCLFGRCAGLARADEPWRAELVLDRVEAWATEHPEGRTALVSGLADLAMSEDVSLPTRARFVRALERLGARRELATMAAAPMAPALADALALARLRVGEAEALPSVIALLDTPRPSVVVEAIRALGAASRLPERAQAEAAAALLSVVTGDVPHSHARAGLDALAVLGFRPAVRGILAWLPAAPAALRDVAFSTLASLAGVSHGADLAAWTGWADAARVAPAPTFTPRARSAEEDIGLPDP